MPVLTEYRHGLTMGNPPGRNDHQRAKRSTVEGWTDASTRRNTRFLYSVDERKLTGHGFGLSLTVRDCPPTGAAWKQLRERFVKRLRRMGMIRMHWLTEWQRRGCPHMHAAVWFDEGLRDRDPMAMATIVDHWVALAAEYGAGPRGQHVAQITDSVGWFQYLSKHAVRGLGHYQRSADGIPPGWERTGRMWGYLANGRPSARSAIRWTCPRSGPSADWCSDGATPMPGHQGTATGSDQPAGCCRAPTGKQGPSGGFPSGSGLTKRRTFCGTWRRWVTKSPADRSRESGCGGVKWY